MIFSDLYAFEGKKSRSREKFSAFSKWIRHVFDAFPAFFACSKTEFFGTSLLNLSGLFAEGLLGEYEADFGIVEVELAHYGFGHVGRDRADLGRGRGVAVVIRVVVARRIGEE